VVFKVVVGLSGGVDSSFSLFLLKKRSYNVKAIFVRSWGEDKVSCTIKYDIDEAKKVCQALDVPFLSLDFSWDYWCNVFEKFLQKYRSGFTPNPDVLCNQKIKFGSLLDYGKVLGVDLVATGHYVRKRLLTNGKFQILKGVDTNKDQSYFLYLLNQAQLNFSLFPVGDFTKPYVREIAKDNMINTHNKKDSNGICFVGRRNLKYFLGQYINGYSGNICDEYGYTLSNHDGLFHYTLGQRKGLGIGGIRTNFDRACFVLKKDIINNVLTVVRGRKSRLLFKRTLKVHNLHWVSGSLPKSVFYCCSKVRYHQSDQHCKIHLDATTDNAFIIFSALQRSVSPGQSIVFYDKDICLGGGIIVC
jgi:tRNA-specific 2-thiouridylase